MRRTFARAFIALSLISLVGCIPPGSLTYPSPQELRVGASVSLSPSVKGIVATFKVSPALPKGLSLNTSTGVISGTPSQEAARANYVILASNRFGSTSFTLDLTVLAVPPSNLQYANPQALVLGQLVNLQPTVTGIVSSYSVTPTLPGGLALNTTTGVISGTASAEAALTTFTITAVNSGGSSSFGLEISVVAAPLQPKNLTFFTEVDNPQILSFETDTQDSVTFQGGKDPNGAALNVSGMEVRSAANVRSDVVNDALGRPVLARLSDGSRIAFEWLSDTRVRATATTADGNTNYSTELNFATPDPLAKAAGALVRNATAFASNAAPAKLRASAMPAHSANAFIPGATINVNVTAWGEPVSDADVLVGVVPVSNLAKAGTYIALEGSPGRYTTPFVNIPSAIPPDTIFRACSSSFGVISNSCKVGMPISKVMVQGGGCFELAAGLSLLIGPEGFAILLPCEAEFAALQFSCTLILSAGDGAAFCGLIDNLAEVFDSEGANVQVGVRKIGVSRTASRHVPSGQSVVDFDVELPLPRYLHANLNGEGNTSLTTELNGQIVRVCEYETTAPVELTLDFAAASPRAVLVNSTFKHSLTSGSCTSVLEGSVAGTRNVALRQEGNSLSGSSQSTGANGSGEVSISAKREGGRVHGTLTETTRLVVQDGPRTHTFKTTMKRQFDAR